jgi:hypothetical protein
MAAIQSNNFMNENHQDDNFRVDFHPQNVTDSPSFVFTPAPANREKYYNNQFQYQAFYSFMEN